MNTTLIKDKKEIQIIYDSSLQHQKIKLMIFKDGKIRKWTSPNLYTLKEIELFILTKIKKGFHIYNSSSKKKTIKHTTNFENIINSIPKDILIKDVKLNNKPIIK